MPETEKEFGVMDLLPLAARTIRDRLRVLEQIDQADAQTKILNKQVARERQELLGMAVQVYQAFLGIPVARGRKS